MCSGQCEGYAGHQQDGLLSKAGPAVCTAKMKKAISPNIFAGL